MSSVLKLKLSHARQSSDAGGDTNALMAQVEPVQIALCETLKAITHQEFDPADVTMTPVLNADLQSLMDTAGLKLSFSGPDGVPHYFGNISPAMVTGICEHSLLFARDSKAAKKPFSPSQLECLLLQPMAKRIGESLSIILNSDIALEPQIGLSFSALGIGKPALKAMGERVNLKLCIKPLTAENADPNDSEKNNQNEDALFIELILPRTRIEDLMRAAPRASEDSAPVLDPTHPWAVHMREAVNAANVPVRAVVESCAMTVAECTRLEIGQVIALPGVSLDAVELFIDMETGPDAKPMPVSLAQGSLGIFKKNRALKMSEEIAPDFIQDLNLHII